MHTVDAAYYSAVDRGAEYCLCVCVCVCVFVRDHIFGTTRPIFTKFFVHVSYGRGSLCTSGFMDDVISQGCSTLPPS